MKKESFKQKLYNRIFDLIAENTSSFALITKKLVKRIDSYPMLYLGIQNSEKITLPNGVQADNTSFDIIIMANNPPENYEKSGNEILLELCNDVEYALAKPANFNENHLGFNGSVKDCYFTRIDFYDDESSGGGDIACVMSLSVISVGDAVTRPAKQQTI